MRESLHTLKDTGSSPHDSAWTHVTGQSEFVDDRPHLPGELLVGVVYSPHARAEILDIDIKAAQNIDGVIAIIIGKDLEHNKWGPIFHDQPLIPANDVNYAGEVVAIIGAENPEALHMASKAIHIKWLPLTATMTIDQAVSEQNFIGAARRIERGDVDKMMRSAPYSDKARLIIEGQDHFYLENQSAIAYPKEQGQWEIHTSTQHPTETQHVVADALGAAYSDVTCIVKRLGGGFGGKESQASPIAAYAALIAQKTGRPARIVLSKDDDMIITGKRNPFQIDYQVGFSAAGEIIALDVQLFSDGGAYADLSTAIMERAMLHSDNAYYIPHMRVTGQVCRTNHHPHTAFRGFGGPKGMAMIELIMERIAHRLGIDALVVRQKNVYRPKFDVTHYGQRVENNQLPALFASLASKCDYQKRRMEIAETNSKDSHSLRGLSLTAVKFGISFTTRYLNQGSAMVILHRDGSVQVSTGAVEMGQGVNARIAALVAEEFGIEVGRVRISATSTDRNANTAPTAASSGTDINGSAAVIGCREIKQRLVRLMSYLCELPTEQWPSKAAALGSHPEFDLSTSKTINTAVFTRGRVELLRPAGKSVFSLTLQELINEAYLSRVSLSDYAFFKIPDLGFNKLSGQGRAFLYFTQGVACSEVAIDRATGAMKVRRVDILMDLGRPINHALDVGQVTGAFVQGMGWVSSEKLVYSNVGLLLSHAPSTYKIPSIQDMPRIFNVDLIENDGNTANIRGTKAAGEPPLMLGLSVWTAVIDALKYVHPKNLPHIRIPATGEEILRALYPERF